MQGQNLPLRKSFEQFNRLLILIKPFWFPIIKGLILGLIINCIGLITPILTKMLIDKVYPGRDISLLNLIVLGILIISLSNAIMTALQNYYTLYINSKMSNSMGLMFFNHLQHLRIRFFDEKRVGEIMSRFQDVNNSIGVINKVFQTVFISGTYLIIVPPVLFFFQWKLALLSIVSLPVTLTVISISGRYIRRNYKLTAEAFAELNAYQVEVLNNIRTIKALVMENQIFGNIMKQISKAINLQLKSSVISQSVGVCNGTLSILNNTLMTWYGWTLILSDQMSLGDYFAFTLYISFLYTPINQIVSLLADFQQSSVNLHRMFEYLDSPVEQEYSKQSLRKSLSLTGNIEIRGVTFGYTPDRTVLNNINIKILPNTTNVFLGPSGSGKTTLIRLLISLETPSVGEIIYDGVPLTDMDIYELRKQITVVWQEFSIFKGSVWDNLINGNNDIRKERVDEIVRICRLEEFINNLPNGYDTVISEWGSTISGGQRQRMSLARALLRDTPILIFDEATSNIDMENENAILQEIFSAIRNKTIIFITHRISSTKYADTVYLLESGQIIDYGPHDALIRKNMSYQKMFSKLSVGNVYKTELI